MIVGFRGASGSGKSTASALARKILEPYPVQEVALAGPLKSFVGACFDIPDRALYGPSVEREMVLNLRHLKTPPFEALRYALRLWGIPVELGFYAPFADWWQGLVDQRQVTARLALQTFGTEFGRQVLGDYVWVDLCLREAARFHGHTLISDVRFDNEVNAIHAAGGTIIELIDTEAHLKQRGPKHASEVRGPAPSDFAIHNNQSRGLEALRQDLVTCLSQVSSGINHK